MASTQSSKVTPQRSATSRLLSMKFMNRLGPASADTSTVAISPLAASPQTPLREEADGDGHAAKRRRTLDAVEDLAGTDGPDSVAAMEGAMQASMAAEEQRRQAAIKKRAAELGDEQWTWDRPLPAHIATQMSAAKAKAAQARTAAYSAVVRVGFAEIDRADEGAGIDTDTRASTKPRIMLYNMKKSQVSTEEEPDEDAGESHKRARSGAFKESGTKLKGLESLSSQGGRDTKKCHRCGRPGHKAVKCPGSSKGSFKGAGIRKNKAR